MPDTKFGCLPTIIGSMPHTDQAKACSLIARYLKDIPAWPQLPNRSFLENMYVQYSEGFPGVMVEIEAGKIYVDCSQDLTHSLEQLYSAYLENDPGKYPIGQDYAAGLHAFLGLKNLSPRAVKGQITGPVTWGLTVTDQNRKAVIYDDVLGDAVPKLLRLKASWQEQALSRISKNTIIFLDEPYMSAFGSVGVMLSREKIISLLDEVFGGISGLKGVHCCGNTDWSILLATVTDIISFDAYNYALSLSLYPAEVKKFLDRGGAIAWGIIPNEAETLAKETVASLKDRLEEAMAPFTRNGVRFKHLVEQGLLTPSCGLAALGKGKNAEEAADKALELLSGLSEAIRKEYL
ncbi:MAG: methionine synthase [Dehalococcoidales bacterium]|nr:methionine synthase [Dehalococcoidales bacterium]